VPPRARRRRARSRAREQRLELVGAAVHVADDVERSLVMPRLDASGSRRSATASTSSGVRSTTTRRNPSRPSSGSVCSSCSRCRRTTSAPSGRRARAAARSTQTASGRSRTSAIAGRSCRRANPSSGARARARDVGGIHHGHAQPPEPLAHDQVQHRERRVGRTLVGLVVAHEGAALVRGDHLGGEEVAPGERGLAAPRRADQHHERREREA
jgi:hypothetical protein